MHYPLRDRRFICARHAYLLRVTSPRTDVNLSTAQTLPHTHRTARAHIAPAFAAALSSNQYDQSYRIPVL